MDVELISVIMLVIGFGGIFGTFIAKMLKVGK